MIDDLVNAGFNARQRRNHSQELEFFRLWKEQQGIPDSDSMQAAIDWELHLSTLKKSNARSERMEWDD